MFYTLINMDLGRVSKLVVQYLNLPMKFSVLLMIKNVCCPFN